MLDGKFNYLTDEQTALIQKFWNTFNPGGLSHDQHVFISLWESLAPVYHEFRNGLESKGLAYEGMAYRKAMQLIANNDSALFPMEQYVFVGFNALNKCEEMLFYHLKNTGKAVFFWDYDDWYVNNGIHEAGFFHAK